MASPFIAIEAKEGKLNSDPTSTITAPIGPRNAPTKAVQHSSFSNHLRASIDDPTADFAIICDGRCFMAHRAILAAKCPYFARMFRFEGAEHNNKKVEIYDIEHELMKHILEFIYTERYKLDGGNLILGTSYCNHTQTAARYGPIASARIFRRKCVAADKCLESSHLLSHIRIYAIADYFDMPLLKISARQGLEDVLHVYWTDPKMDWKDALDEIFSNTPDEDRGLRQVMIDVLKAHPRLWVDEGDIASWLSEHPSVLEEVDCDL